MTAKAGHGIFGCFGPPVQGFLGQTIEFFRDLPDDLMQETHFDLARMDELALDMRAHDHTHPVNKRTNYMFGEWDPHLIDTKGFYRRFVLRKIILDSLLEWVEQPHDLPHEEVCSTLPPYSVEQC